MYAKWFDRGATPNLDDDGSDRGQDDWTKLQAGFRMDGGSGRNRFTVQGDYQTRRAILRQPRATCRFPAPTC